MLTPISGSKPNQLVGYHLDLKDEEASHQIYAKVAMDPGLKQKLPLLRIRYYSNSPSPLADPTHCTMIYNPLSIPSLTGPGYYAGICGTYLRSLNPVTRSVRPLLQNPFESLSISLPTLTSIYLTADEEEGRCEIPANACTTDMFS
jgi:hypothetical protein